MNTLVMKFLDSSFKSENVFAKMASVVAERYRIFPRIIIVLDSFHSVNDSFWNLVKGCPKKSFKLPLSDKERVFASCLQSALKAKGIRSIFFDGVQSGIITCAKQHESKIIDVRCHNIAPYLSRGEIVIVSGRQGKSFRGDPTILGEGGGDTAAIALASAFSATKAEFYTDLAATSQRAMKAWLKVEVNATIEYEKIRRIAKRNNLIHSRSIELAEKQQTPIHIASFRSYLRKKRAVKPKESLSNRYHWKIASQHGVFISTLLGKEGALV